MRRLRLTGHVLAGGRSRRFGSDKARLKIGGASLLARTVRLLRSVADDVAVVVDAERRAPRLRGVRIVRDVLPDLGPLGGIYAGLVRSRTRYNLFVACDMPFLTRAALDLLLSRCRDADVTLPRVGRRLEPLCAVYDRGCRGVLRRGLLAGDLKIVGVIRRLKTRTVEDPLFDGRADLFLNVNTPGDLRRAERAAARGYVFAPRARAASARAAAASHAGAPAASRRSAKGAANRPRCASRKRATASAATPAASESPAARA